MKKVIDITKEQKKKERETQAFDRAKKTALDLVNESFLYVDARELWCLGNYIRSTMQGFWESQIRNGRPAPEWALKPYEEYIKKNVNNYNMAKAASAKVRKEVKK